ncbi:MAG: ABC transporter permease [Candidatus Nezhaarchaeales archaeon]
MSIGFVEGLMQAILLMADPAVMEITLRSIQVSGVATLIATLCGLPLGVVIGLTQFKGKRLVKAFFNALLGVPTVALGLILYLFFSRSGPLGFLRLLYNPLGIIIGQALLVVPIAISLTLNSIEALDPQIKDLAKTLGASRLQVSLTLCREAKGGILLAVIASFNKAIAELGVALMIGGNIKGLTRVLTTAIALETAKGEIAISIALTIILLSIVFALNLAVNLLQKG